MKVIKSLVKDRYKDLAKSMATGNTKKQKEIKYNPRLSVRKLLEEEQKDKPDDGQA
jgi:hypothetical protein